MYLDDIHRHRPRIIAGNIPVQVPCDDSRLLLRRRRESKETSLELGDLPDRIDVRIAGPQITIDDNAPVILQSGILRDVNIRHRTDREDQGVALQLPSASQLHSGQPRFPPEQLYLVRV